jgi:hypothetical protein
LSIDPGGILSAYQLKTAKSDRLTLREWRGISSQIDDMVCRHIQHPSVPACKPHRSYLVTNGWLEESVTQAINDRNRQWEVNGQPERRKSTIIRPDLLKWACELGVALWPDELRNMKLFLEILLHRSDGPLPIKEFAKLLEEICPIRPDLPRPNKAKCRRMLASTAIISSISNSHFSERQNHAAEITGWVLYLASVFATAERCQLSQPDYSSEASLAREFLYRVLGNLCQEVMQRETLIEGEPLYDNPFGFRKVRITWLAAMLSIFVLWRRQESIPETDVDAFAHGS